MNFALLGTTPLLKQLAAQIADRVEHQVVFSEAEWGKLDLVALDQSTAEVIVLDGAEDEVTLIRTVESLKVFAGGVLVVHPCTRAVLAAYEVERLATDAVGRIVPLLPLLQHPAARVLERSVLEPAESTPVALGQIERVEMQRAIVTTGKDAAFDAFVQDVTVLVALSGPIKEVVAMRVSDEPMPVNVQCMSQSGRLVRWSALRSLPTDAAAQLLIEGTEGRTTVRLGASGQWDVETASGVQAFSPLDLVASCVSAATASGPVPDWRGVTHSLEVREAAEKSLRRGRLIRLNLDGYGERTAFKGTMATLGCGLLLGGLLLMVLTAAILSIADVSGFGWFAVWLDKMPWALAGLMILFLLMQLFTFVIPRGKED